ncbi:MAG: zf-TFIIB domain-containing protein [Candidatus Aminicenantes bacterium]|nr:zf-TFIIB domain-containing protein [Candidatus Aminicenantes bacterium]
MANCVNCAAPLPKGSNICKYCGTRNDVDLKMIHEHTIHEPESERTCPRCKTALQTINLKIEGKFLIEKCNGCFGLFFDPGELEALVDKSVTNVFDVNYNRIRSLGEQRRHDDYPVRYIKCPVCGKLMNRINFGSRSGVVVDKCKQHGLWLDGGELRQIMEWVKAGGQLLHHQKRMEMERLDIQREKRKIRQNAMKVGGAGGLGRFGSAREGGRTFGAMTGSADLLGLVGGFVSKILL